jgi:hypothetical protein
MEVCENPIFKSFFYCLKLFFFIFLDCFDMLMSKIN